jgi:hypothetical protein
MCTNEDSHHPPGPSKGPSQLLAIPADPWKPWVTFFADHAERYARHPLDAKQEERRRNRERQPPNKNTKLFWWEENDEGVRIRTSIIKAKFEDYFDLYTGDRIRYDPRANEWDSLDAQYNTLNQNMAKILQK